jgi:AraC family transcriptional regulator, melibiose operon regulatory protein
LTYLFGGHKVVVRAGRLAAFWAAIPHQIVQSVGCSEYFVATIPLAWALQCQLPEHMVRALLSGQIVSQRDRSQSDGDELLFARWFEDLRLADGERRRIVLLETEARLRRLALSLPARMAARAGDGRPPASAQIRKVEQMAGFIVRHYTQPLRVADIADAVNLHPNYAMNLFRKAFGVTLVDYLTQHRISHAQRLLATTDRAVLDIAMDCGFNSISRFNDAFRRACTCSPRQYRQSHQHGS